MKFFPPPKTPENAAFWPFESKEAMDRADRSWEESQKAVVARREGYSYETFQRFLKNGVHRAPKLYGPGEGKVVEPPKDSNVVSPGPLGNVPRKLKDALDMEQPDWKQKQAGDWDSVEDAEIVENEAE